MPVMLPNVLLHLICCIVLGFEKNESYLMLNKSTWLTGSLARAQVATVIGRNSQGWWYLSK